MFKLLKTILGLGSNKSRLDQPVDPLIVLIKEKTGLKINETGLQALLKECSKYPDLDGYRLFQIHKWCLRASIRGFNLETIFPGA